MSTYAIVDRIDERRMMIDKDFGLVDHVRRRQQESLGRELVKKHRPCSSCNVCSLKNQPSINAAAE